VGGPTFFEIVTAIALLHFVERQVDAAVLEVGLGGRLDATNVCLPAVSVITSISFDHTKQLGDTLAAIAREKAGIIKPGVPVVCGVADEEPQVVIAAAAREHGCRLIQLGRDFAVRYHPPYSNPLDGASNIQGGESASVGAKIDFHYGVAGQELDLTSLPLAMLGPHQAANAAVAMAAIAELGHQGWFISTQAMHSGLSQTAVPGRVELLPPPSLLKADKGRAWTVVLDVAHNAASARALVESLAELPSCPHRSLILSISRDKDFRAIVTELAPHFDRILVTQYLENPRAVAADELASVVREVLAQRTSLPAQILDAGTLPGIAASRDSSYSSPEIVLQRVPAEAWTTACDLAVPGELICIAGSFFLAAELRPLVRACG
jgi:dihydrofolate synthase/folylpolyglutamate synthase